MEILRQIPSESVLYLSFPSTDSKVYCVKRYDIVFVKLVGVCRYVYNCVNENGANTIFYVADILAAGSTDNT